MGNSLARTFSLHVVIPALVAPMYHTSHPSLSCSHLPLVLIQSSYGPGRLGQALEQLSTSRRVYNLYIPPTLDYNSLN